MKHAGDVLFRHGNKILNDQKYAMFSVAIFAVLPFTFWLSAAIVALITLRKGREAGFNILLPAMVSSLIYMYTMLPLDLAFVNVLIRFLPVYLGACVLRNTASWSYVFGSFFLLAFTCALMLQIFLPDLILAQYQYIQVWISRHPELTQLVGKQSIAWNTDIAAHLFFGMQVTFSFILVIISLLFARFVQSKLFFPGEFRREITGFRSGKYALATLTIMLISGWLGVNLAIDVLPFMFFYFLMSGLSLSFVLLEKKIVLGLAVTLISLFINPVVMILICAGFGVLDSLFNFRMYTSARTC